MFLWRFSLLAPNQVRVRVRSFATSFVACPSTPNRSSFPEDGKRGHVPIRRHQKQATRVSLELSCSLCN